MSDLSKLLDAIATIQFNLGYLQAMQEKTREEIDAMKERIKKMERTITGIYNSIDIHMSAKRSCDAIGREVAND